MEQNSSAVRVHQPCKDCGSSDALAVYSDGHTYCFSCSSYRKNVVENLNTFQIVPWRGISSDTMAFFDAKTLVSEEGMPLEIHFRWPNGRTQIRSRLNKDFRVTGERSAKGELGGMEKFPAGSAKAITITEGYLDMMAVFQMLGSKYPVVTVSSASSARKECAAEFDYLNSFEKIYLAFDTDEPGQKAKEAVASLFDFNKVYDVKMDQKDPNQYLTEPSTRPELFVKAWWSAKRFLPEGVISTYTEIDKILDDDKTKVSVPWPLATLQEMTYGIRTGEFVLFTALEGIGKTEIFRMIEYGLLKSTDDNVGIIHLEEGKSRMVKGLAGYELQTPVHLPDTQASPEEIKAAIRKVTGRDERIHIYTHFGSDDPDTILNAIRFMAGPCGCKRIFLDHITMVVTGTQGDDERRQLDYLSTKLAHMVEDQDFTLFVISHVNDDGLTRGSRNISKVCDLHVHLDRDVVSPDPEIRNTTYLTVRKNRFAGKTGPAGILLFDPATFMLSEQLKLPE